MYGILTKEYILRQVSQQEIFESFLGLPVKAGERYRSPLRSDKHPTCEYRLKNDKIYFVDYSGDFFGDCFDAVQRMYGVNYTKSLDIIAERFGLIDVKVEKTRQAKTTIQKHTFKSYSEIEVMIREWEKEDLAYWNKFNINLDVLKHYCVFPLQNVFLNKRIVYGHSQNDPAYGYRFGTKKYKIYFPLRRNGRTRFISNTTHIQGLRQLPKKGKLLILTKSLKDVMTLYSLGLNSIAFQSEAIVPSAEELKPFIKNWETIVSLYDFDRSGVRSANKMRKLYGIKPVFLTNGRFGTVNYKSKDAADYVADHGREEAYKLKDLWMSYL